MVPKYKRPRKTRIAMSERVLVRCTPDEMETWLVCADKTGAGGICEWIRQIARNASGMNSMLSDEKLEASREASREPAQ